MCNRVYQQSICAQLTHASQRQLLLKTLNLFTYTLSFAPVQLPSKLKLHSTLRQARHFCALLSKVLFNFIHVNLALAPLPCGTNAFKHDMFNLLSIGA